MRQIHLALSSLILTGVALGQEPLFVPPNQAATKKKDKTPTPIHVSLRVRFVNTKGEPVEGVGMSMGNTAKRDADHDLCRSKPLVRSNAQGILKHSFVYKPDLRHSILFAAKGYASLVARLKGKAETKDDKQVQEVDYGDVVLQPGVDLLGLVRGADKAALAGATAVTADVLDRILSNRRKPNRHIRQACYGISDAQGRLRLRGIPHTGVQVTINAEDHYQLQLPFVNRHTPLVANLQPGGKVSGRVLDQHGNPPDKAYVYLYSESTKSSKRLEVDAAGNFAGPLPGSGRYRLRYSVRAKGDNRYRYSYSKVYDKPRDDILFRVGHEAKAGAAAKKTAKKVNPMLEALKRAAGPIPGAKAVAKKAAKGKLNLRLLDARNGMPIRKGRGTVVWWNDQQFGWNPGYLSNQFSRVKDQDLNKDGVLALTGPNQGQPQTGRAIVAAPGFAPKILKDLEFDQGKVNLQDVKLEIEAILSGRVIDPVTGKGLEGVKVFALHEFTQLRRYNPQPVRRKIDGAFGTTTTDKDGKFKLGQLPTGDIEVFVAHPKRTDIPPVSTRLKAGVTSQLEIRYAKGASLIGKITGIPLLRGAKVQVKRMTEPQRHMGGMTWGLSASDASESADVDAEGRFRFDGLPKANYFLTLLYPHAQGFLELKMEPVRMRRSKDLERTFDLSDDLPGAVTGRVKLRGGAIPLGQLILVARPFHLQNRSFSYNHANIIGTHTQLQPNGAFRLPLSEGQFHLLVVDMKTRLTLWQDTRATRIRSNGATQRDIEITLGRVVLEFKPKDAKAGLAAVHRIEIRASHPKPKGPQQPNIFFGNNNHQDSGVGIPVPAGATRVELFLPTVECKLRARSHAHQLDPKLHEHNFPPLGEVEVSPKLGESKKVELEVSKPSINTN